MLNLAFSLNAPIHAGLEGYEGYEPFFTKRKEKTFPIRKTENGVYPSYCDRIYSDKCLLHKEKTIVLHPLPILQRLMGRKSSTCDGQGVDVSPDCQRRGFALVVIAPGSTPGAIPIYTYATAEGCS